MATESPPSDLYLDLLKKTLSFSLWPEPPAPVETFRDSHGPLKRAVVWGISKVLATRRLVLAKLPDVDPAEKAEGKIWPGYAHTMIGLKRLDNLQVCLETVLRERIAGDVIETGVWRGGACIFMRAVLAAYGVADRKVYVADSFAGLPPPAPEIFPADAGDTCHTHHFLSISQETVAENFRRYGLLDEQVVFLKGWFEDTLPTAPMTQLAVIRLDGDMYGSTMVALQNLYPKLSPGGFCIIDDYALKGCRQAVTDYRAKHEITTPLVKIDWTGSFWRKESPAG